MAGNVLIKNANGNTVTLQNPDTNFSDVVVDTSAIAELTDFTGSNQSLSTSGYQKLPGGLIVQWGMYTLANGATPTITFPITFPNQCLFISIPYAQGGPAYETFYTSKSNTGFVAGNATGGTQYVSWFAIGY